MNVAKKKHGRATFYKVPNSHPEFYEDNHPKMGKDEKMLSNDFGYQLPLTQNKCQHMHWFPWKRLEKDIIRSVIFHLCLE